MKKILLPVVFLIFLANNTLAQPVTYGDPGKFVTSMQYKQVQGINNAYLRAEYRAVTGLSREVGERLMAVKPRSLGQAARVPGVTAAAVALLAVFLKRTGRT